LLCKLIHNNNNNFIDNQSNIYQNDKSGKLIQKYCKKYNPTTKGYKKLNY